MPSTPYAHSWRPHRLVSGLVVLALGLVLGSAPHASADETLTKEVKAANLKWTLPNDGYKWLKVAASDKQAGVVAAAQALDGSVHAMLMTGPSNNLELGERTKEVGQMIAPYAGGGVTAQKTLDTVFTGHPGTVVVIAGETPQGTVVQIRGYSSLVGKRFYHLILRCFNGSQESRVDELNALRAGVTLFKGQGKQTTKETFAEVGDGGAASAGGSPTGENEPWPAKGPKRDGNKVTFPGFNLEWTKPEDSPFVWRDPIEDLSKAYSFTKSGASIRPVLWWDGQLKREPKEFDPEDVPTKHSCTGVMHVVQLQFAWNTQEYVRSPRFEDKMKQTWGLSELISSKTRVRELKKLGNFKGTMVTMRGERKKGDGTIDLVYIETVLRGWMYRWEFAISGFAKDRFKAFQPAISAALAGIHFPENNDFAAGPLATEGITLFGGTRGKNIEKQTKYKRSGLSWSSGAIAGSKPGYSKTKGLAFVKPKGISELASNPTHLLFAGEGRSADGQNYVYLSVFAEAVARLRHEKKSEETMLDGHAAAWRGGAGDDAKCSKSGKPPFGKAGAWKGEKGLKYTFYGAYGKKPYVEEGYIVKSRQTVYWIRIQTGGPKGAKDKEIKKMIKSFKKGFKWD